jgi:hypothetical protein
MPLPRALGVDAGLLAEAGDERRVQLGAQALERAIGAVVTRARHGQDAGGCPRGLLAGSVPLEQRHVAPAPAKLAGAQQADDAAADDDHVRH